MTQILNVLRTGDAPHRVTDPIIEMDKVSVSYAAGNNGGRVAQGKVYALKDVSFQIGLGERIAVIGPNGAGKSTLFKLIVGAIRPSKGTVHIYGDGPDDHICIGYVPQRTQIDFSFPVTVADVVMMGRVGQIGLFRWPRRRDRDIVQQSLERVNASHLAGTQIGELSGGQQQRVFIARALAQEAELLLLDEPLAGLDHPSQEAIFEVLDALRPHHVTVLLATHDLGLAAEQFDKVMLLNKQLIAFGRPQAVLTPDHLLVAYGGHVHVLNGQADTVLFTDTCCDHGEELATHRTARPLAEE